MNLFIDTSNWNLIILLEKNNVIVDSLIIHDCQKISDFFLEEVNKILKKNKTNIKEIKKLYLTTGPGSYTGERIALVMGKTLLTLDPNYQIYLINSLLYQAGDQKTISILDARGDKSYLGIYDHGQKIIDEVVVENKNLATYLDSQEYQGYRVVKDYENLDFQGNFLALKPYFRQVSSTEEIKPTYLKSFI